MGDESIMAKKSLVPVMYPFKRIFDGIATEPKLMRSAITIGTMPNIVVISKRPPLKRKQEEPMIP